MEFFRGRGSMQAGQTVVVSAVAASIAAVALFLPGAVRSPSGLAALFPTYWPGFIIFWLAAYSVVALVLSTATAVRELGGAAAGEARLDWPRRYLLRLGLTQYFSAVLVLFALGLLPVAVATEPFFSLPAAIGTAPGFFACAVGILIGVIGWLLASAVAAFRAPADWTASSTGLDSQLLQEIVELLRARPVGSVSATAELAEQLRQRDRSTLEAIKELAGAVNRVRIGVSDIQHALQRREPEQSNQSDGTAAINAAEAAGELRTATAALTTSVTKLEDFVAGLSMAPAVAAARPARAHSPPGSRSQLSNELQEVLRDIATGPAP